jgi:hypothetical protein
MVNLGFNDNEALLAGNKDSKYPADFALRNNLVNTITPTMRIIGVYGYKRLADGSLRSLGLIIANGTN